MPAFGAFPPAQPPWNTSPTIALRPSMPATSFRFSLPANAMAPDEGEVTLFINECFLRHLHCARHGSYLLFADEVPFRISIPAFWLHPHFGFQKLALPYEEARQLFQTIWWMSQARSRKVTNDDFMDDDIANEYPLNMCSDTASLSVRIVSHRGDAAFEGFQNYSGIPDFAGVAANSGSYSYGAAAFVNLVAQLFDREIPDHLGKPWPAAATSNRWQESGVQPEREYTAKDKRRFKDSVIELLNLYREHKLPIDVARSP